MARYVGLTKLIAKRWGEHLSAAKNGSSYPLHRAMRKYGVPNFTVVCLEVVEGVRADLLAAEIRQIATHDCLTPKGYNLTSGGEGVDFSIPEILERSREGARKRSANPKWQRNVAEAALKRAADPVCQEKLREGVRKRTANPEWRKNVAEGAKKRAADLEYRDACSRGAQAKLANPEWRKQNLEQLRKQHADPEWQKANAEGLRKAWETVAANAIARDAHLPPEERARKARRREQNRIYKAEKRARGKAASP